MLWHYGRSLNVISLAGLAFAVGMLVDNAVVVLENIYRRREQGDSAFAAAAKGTTEVAGAVVASTLTTIAVFIPVLFVQDTSGQLFRDIALAIAFAVALSMLVSFSMIPTAAARLFRAPLKSRSSHVPPHNDGSTKLAQSGPPGVLVSAISQSGLFFADRVADLNRWLIAKRFRSVVLLLECALFHSALVTCFGPKSNIYRRAIETLYSVAFRLPRVTTLKR